jgi:RNA polymerase sigma factor (TIGR02999 family)
MREMTAAEISAVSAAATQAQVANEALLNSFYSELRGLAARVLANDRDVLAIQPTELLHEAAMRVLRLDRLTWNDHQHFLATCVRLMRQVIIDEVRKVRAQKRQHIAVTTSFGDIEAEAVDVDIVALDSALTRLEVVNPDYSRIVELRYFVGLSIEEIARLLGVSESTVKRQWRGARAWLLTQMTAEPC